MKKKAIILLLVFTCFLSTISIPAKAHPFTIRTTHPTYGVDYYYSSPQNPYSVNSSTGGNCTWYAFGRAYEVLGTKPHLVFSGNADSWYPQAQSQGYYSVGQTPRIGSIACFGSPNCHVAFVEDVNSDGTVTITQSAWGGKATFIVYNFNPKAISGFQGYIYLPVVTTPSVPAPSAPVFYGMKSEYMPGETITFKWNSVSNADSYSLLIMRNDEFDFEWPQNVTSGITRKYYSGVFTASIFAHNAGGYNSSDFAFHIGDYNSVTVKPTCTEPGYTTHTCSICNRIYTDSITSALGHNWGTGTVIVSPTSFQSGIREYTCSRCHEKKTENIPPVGYIELNNPDVSTVFKDVKTSDWFNSAVDFVYYRNLMSGVGTGHFSPGGKMSRAMLVTVLWRIEGSPAPSGTSPFVDLRSDWYKKAVVWASEKGIVKGTSSTKFSPDASITREQIATILFRYASYIRDNVSSRGNINVYPDAEKVSSYAKEAVSWAISKGIITGNKIGTRTCIDPASNATRAQVATMIMRFLQKSSTKNVTGYRYDLNRVRCECGRISNHFDIAFVGHLYQLHDKPSGGSSNEIAYKLIKDSSLSDKDKVSRFVRESGVKAYYEEAVAFTANKLAYDESDNYYTYNGEKWYSPNSGPTTSRIYD